MDVRCERCQTEYELDDASIPEAGVHVQCTTCGYTFLVKRSADSGRAENGRVRTDRLTTTTAAPSGDPSLSVTRDDLPAAPSPAPWILETEDGRVHRLRDMTTLQKWVVERRVTAADRLSRDGGGAWRELGNVDELVPFFSVVAEADRAKTGTSTSPSAPTTAFRGPASSPLLEGGRGRGGPPRPPVDSFGAGHAVLGGRAAPVGVSSPPGLSPVEGGADHRLPVFDESGPGSIDGPDAIDFDDSDMLRPRRRGPVALAVILLLAGAAGGGYYLFGHKLGLPGIRSADVAPTATTTTPAPPPSTTPPATTPAAPTTATPSAALPGAPPAPAGPAAVEGRSDKAVAGPAPGAAPPPAALPAEGAAGNVPSEAGAGAKPPASRAAAYDRLVAEGDKLLENGQTNRAERLYMQALATKPDGVGALTGTAYVFLDRGHTQKAMETFLRALALDPRHGPAIFGLAEAYRAQGDPGTALNTYRRYLTVSPNGTDAPAARRQVHDLEAAGRSASPGADETP